ncbi:hypothetical protein IHE44_0002847 [Lamprotornis superbus]|uniref:Uncharacterized protein n=1 Tax=Lamprotornis superbus TaxID=245042 RepID=A0A835P6S2_9PASS|nr:hypothetical protein IHE44_0002847 [Lamprotornis superbus]
MLYLRGYVTENQSAITIGITPLITSLSGLFVFPATQLLITLHRSNQHPRQKLMLSLGVLLKEIHGSQQGCITERPRLSANSLGTRCRAKRDGCTYNQSDDKISVSRNIDGQGAFPKFTTSTCTERSLLVLAQALTSSMYQDSPRVEPGPSDPGTKPPQGDQEGLSRQRGLIPPAACDYNSPKKHHMGYSPFPPEACCPPPKARIKASQVTNSTRKTEQKTTLCVKGGSICICSKWDRQELNSTREIAVSFYQWDKLSADENHHCSTKAVIFSFQNLVTAVQQKCYKHEGTDSQAQGRVTVTRIISLGQLFGYGMGYADLYYLRIRTIEFKRITNGVRSSSSPAMASESDSACVQEQRIDNCGKERQLVNHIYEGDKYRMQMRLPLLGSRLCHR